MTARYCSSRSSRPRSSTGLTAERRGALVGGSRIWVNGTVLHYYFFDSENPEDPENTAGTDASVIPVPGTGEMRRVPWGGAKEQQDVVRECFRECRGLGIGVDFAEVGTVRRLNCASGSSPVTAPGPSVGREALTVGCPTAP